MSSACKLQVTQVHLVSHQSGGYRDFPSRKEDSYCIQPGFSRLDRTLSADDGTSALIMTTLPGNQVAGRNNTLQRPSRNITQAGLRANSAAAGSPVWYDSRRPVQHVPCRPRCCCKQPPVYTVRGFVFHQQPFGPCCSQVPPCHGKWQLTRLCFTIVWRHSEIPCQTNAARNGPDSYSGVSYSGNPGMGPSARRSHGQQRLRLLRNLRQASRVRSFMFLATCSPADAFCQRLRNHALHAVSK